MHPVLVAHLILVCLENSTSVICLLSCMQDSLHATSMLSGVAEVTTLHNNNQSVMKVAASLLSRGFSMKLMRIHFFNDIHTSILNTIIVRAE